MKPNTSNNDEHELEKKRWKNVENSKAIPFIGIKDKLYCESIDVMMLVSVAKEQGYAEALADVKKMIDKAIKINKDAWDKYHIKQENCLFSSFLQVNLTLKELRQSLAKLKESK